MTKPKRKSTVQKNIKGALQARLDAEKAYKDMIGEAGGQLIERIIVDNEGIETVEDVTKWYEETMRKVKEYDQMVANKKAKILADVEKAEAEAKAKAAAEKPKTSGEGQPKPTPTAQVPGTAVTGSGAQVTMQPRPTQPVNGSQQRT